MQPSKTMEELSKRLPVRSSSPCPFSNYMVHASCWWNQIEKYSAWAAAYRECADDAARFAFAENFLEKVLKLELKPKVIFHGKDEAKAEAARQRGNRLFTRGDLPGALAAYNESIINACFEDRSCIVLALGNRSAVFFRLERYAECIRDIDQTVMLGYPLNSVKKLLMRKAKAFLAVGYPLAAILVLEKEGHLLEVCSGETEEIRQLDGDMKDYADLLALALTKQEEDESSNVAAARCPKPDLQPKYPTGWNKEDEMRALKLRGGGGRRFSFLSASASLLDLSNSKQPCATFVADRDFDAGDVILKEPAFASVVNKRASLTNCNACLCWTDAPFPCSQCSVVVFCSMACSNSPKAAVHARECSFWLTIRLSDEEDREHFVRGRKQDHETCLFALRTLLTKPAEDWLALVNEQLNSSSSEMPTRLEKRRYREDDVMDVLWLTSVAGGDTRPGALKGKVNAKDAFIAVYLVKLLETAYFSGITLSKRARRRLGAIIMQVGNMCRREADCVKELFSPSVEKEVTSAAVLHPIYSQFAKSCNPNLIRIHYGDVAVVRARRPIRKCEALTASYGFPIFALMSRDGFRLALESCGHNACSCRACREKWPTMDVLEAENQLDLYKVKCPFCSHVFGRFHEMLLRMKRRERLTDCPKCEADARVVYTAMSAVFTKYCRGGNSQVPYSDDETVDDLFSRIQALRSVYVDPSFLLVQADGRLERALMMRSGNKRFDSVLPYPEHESLKPHEQRAFGVHEQLDAKLAFGAHDTCVD